MTNYLDQLARAMAPKLAGSDTDMIVEALTAALACPLTDPCPTCRGAGAKRTWTDADIATAIERRTTAPHTDVPCPACQDEDGNPTGRVPASAQLMLGEQVGVGCVECGALKELPPASGDWQHRSGCTSVASEPVYRRISPEDTP